MRISMFVFFFRTYFFFFRGNSTNDLSAVGALWKTASIDSKEEIRERFYAVLTSRKFSKGGLRSVVEGGEDTCLLTCFLIEPPLVTCQMADITCRPDGARYASCNLYISSMR